MANKNPKTEPPSEPFQVVFFKEDDGSRPLLDWLDQLKPPKAVAKCRVVIELLRKQGRSIRRPHADYLRDDIYELRTKLGNVRYRLLYFLHGSLAVLTHGFAKTVSKVPDREIDAAVTCRQHFLADPKNHTYKESE
jgi:phage-related protein